MNHILQPVSLISPYTFLIPLPTFLLRRPPKRLLIFHSFLTSPTLLFNFHLMYIPIVPPPSTIQPRYEHVFVDLMLAQISQVGQNHTVGVVCAIIFYALHFLIFCVTLCVQHKRQLKSPTIWATLVTLLLLSSAQFTLQMVEGWLGLVKASNPTTIYGSADNLFHPTKSLVLIATVALSEAVFLWRLHHVRAGSWESVGGSASFLVTGIGAYIVVVHFQIQQYFAGTTSQFTAPIHFWTVFGFITTGLGVVVFNVLIATRMWRQHHRTTPNQFDLTTAIMIECGALFTLALAVLGISYALSEQRLFTIISYIFPFIVSIAPTMSILMLQPTMAPPPSPSLNKPKLSIVAEDALSLRCAGLDEHELDDLWAATSAITEAPMTRPFERRGYI